MIRSMLKEFRECEKETSEALMQLAQIRLKLLEAYNMEDNKEFDLNEVTQIPFAAYEMQLERHLEEKRESEERHLKEKEQIHDRNEREKEKIRKHYKNIVMWISITFLAFIIAVFGTIIWFFNTYQLMSYEQDSTYGNANFIGNDGDITNGETDYYLGKTEE